MLSLVHLGPCGGLSGSPVHLFPSSSELQAGGGVGEGRAKSAKYGQTLYLPNPALILGLQRDSVRDCEGIWEGGEVKRGQVWGHHSSAHHLRCLAQGPMQEGEIQTAKGNLSPTSKVLLWGQERGEGIGQRSGVRFLSLKGMSPQSGKMRKPEKLEYFQPPSRFPRRRRRDTRSPGSRGSSTELVAASRVTSGSLAKAEMTGHVFSIKLTWEGSLVSISPQTLS